MREGCLRKKLRNSIFALSPVQEFLVYKLLFPYDYSIVIFDIEIHITEIEKNLKIVCEES